MVFFFDRERACFRRSAKGPAAEDRAGRKAYQVKGSRSHFITQSSQEGPRHHSFTAWQQGTARASRILTRGPEGSQGRTCKTFRPNPAFETEEAITQLGTGEALVSFLAEDGSPGIVERAFILPPQSQMGIVDDSVRKEVLALSEIGPKYDVLIDGNQHTSTFL